MTETIIVTAENIGERELELSRLETKLWHPAFDDKKTLREQIMNRIEALRAAIRQWEEDDCWARRKVAMAKSSPSDFLLIMSPAI